MVNPSGSLRNKICTPSSSPFTIRTGSHTKLDFNSPHSPVCNKCALGWVARNRFQSDRETMGMVMGVRFKVQCLNVQPSNFELYDLASPHPIQDFPQPVHQRDLSLEAYYFGCFLRASHRAVDVAGSRCSMYMGWRCVTKLS